MLGRPVKFSNYRDADNLHYHSKDDAKTFPMTPRSLK